VFNQAHGLVFHIVDNVRILNN